MFKSGSVVEIFLSQVGKRYSISSPVTYLTWHAATVEDPSLGPHVSCGNSESVFELAELSEMPSANARCTYQGFSRRIHTAGTPVVFSGTFLDEATSAAVFGSIHAKHPLGNPTRMGLQLAQVEHGSYHRSCSSMIRDVYSKAYLLPPASTSLQPPASCVWGNPVEQCSDEWT